jgi:hypothetical protein
MYAALNGGSYLGFTFSKTEKYDVLPKLLKMGWVTKEKVVNYRKVLNKYSCKNIYFNLSEENLVDISSFKAMLIATTEKYLLDVKSSIKDKKRIKIDSLGKKIKVNWDKLRVGSRALLNTEKKIDTFGNTSVSGRAFNAEISRIMNISESTITRWRKESKERDINKYLLIDINCSKNLKPMSKSIAEDRVSRRSVYRKKDNNIYTRDLYITSSLDLFKIKIK